MFFELSEHTVGVDDVSAPGLLQRPHESASVRLVEDPTLVADDDGDARTDARGLPSTSTLPLFKTLPVATLMCAIITCLRRFVFATAAHADRL